MRPTPPRFLSPDHVPPQGLPEARRARGVDAAGVDLPWLGRYGAYAALAAFCAMVAVWSRIEMRNLAVELDKAERAWSAARSEQDRLQLELATLRDPRILAERASTLGLQASVDVVEVEPEALAP